MNWFLSVFSGFAVSAVLYAVGHVTLMNFNDGGWMAVFGMFMALMFILVVVEFVRMAHNDTLSI